MAILLIILKILLIILLVLLGIVLLVLIMPVGAEVSYIDGKLTYKVKLWLLNVMDSQGGGVIGWLKKRKKKPKKPKKPKPVKEKKNGGKKKKVDDDAYLEDFDFDADDTVSETSDSENPSVTDSVHEENSRLTDVSSSDGDEKDENTVSETAVSSDDTDEKVTVDDNKRSLSDWAELGIGIWESAQRPLLKIFKGFHFKDLYIDFIIADEDAYDCALKYGKYSGMIYNIIAFMSTLFTVRLKTVDVGCGFGLKKGRWDISCRLFFRAGTAVIAGLWFLITYLTRTFIPAKIRKIRRKKSAARQK